MNPAQLQRLRNLLSCPTAPFRETLVMAEVESQLQSAAIPYFYDQHRNIVVGVASEKAYKKILSQRSKEPVRVFIAHMDHPGFHGVRWLSEKRLSIKWFGGSPIKHVAGRKVWLASDDGLLAEGTLKRVVLRKDKRAIQTAEVVLDKPLEEDKKTSAKKIFGGFNFRSPVWQSGKRIYTRAADDLVGVFAIMETARQIQSMAKRNKQPSFIGLLTRGEEVGFVGAVAHLESGFLNEATRPVVAVSLEASRTLPGAIIGKGPVVRLGDWRTVFESGGLKVLSDLAMKLLPGKHQRRVMDGGSCEATAMTAWGIKTIGISLPLGNYHNEGYEGGMDCPAHRGPAPEFVHLDDIDGELKLCQGLMKTSLAWDDPWQQQRSRLCKNLKSYQRYL